MDPFVNSRVYIPNALTHIAHTLTRTYTYGRKKVPCPIDPRHTVFEHKLEHHLRVCNMKKEAEKLNEQPFYKEGCNAGTTTEAIDGPPIEHTLPTARVLATAVLATYSSLFPNDPPLLDLSSAELNAGLIQSLRQRKIAAGGTKHVQQQASIIGHLRRTGLAPPLPSAHPASQPATTPRPTTILEMGAGRGMLGLLVSGVCGAISAAAVCLTMVERSSVRRKAGAHCDRRDTSKDGVVTSDYPFDSSGVKSDLVRVDLEHALLTEVVKDEERDVVVIAKHLCGAGTDLALRAVEKIKHYPNLKGICMATCCHGVCDFKHLVGREFLVEQFKTCGNFKLTKSDFDLMRKWAAATTADRETEGGKGKESKEAQEEAQDEHPVEAQTNSKNYVGAGAVCDSSEFDVTKQTLGRCVQRLIDRARVEYMKNSLNMDGLNEVVYYVSSDVTPQNALLCGKRSSGKEEEEAPKKQRLN